MKFDRDAILALDLIIFTLLIKLHVALVSAEQRNFSLMNLMLLGIKMIAEMSGLRNTKNIMNTWRVYARINLCYGIP